MNKFEVSISWCPDSLTSNYCIRATRNGYSYYTLRLDTLDQVEGVGKAIEQFVKEQREAEKDD
jgi:hypothetical protein